MKFTIALLAILAVSGLAEPATQPAPKVAEADHPSLRIRIAVPESRTVAAEDHHSHFHVAIQNISGYPQKVIDEWNSWGYFNLHFEYTTPTGEKMVMEKLQREFQENFPTTTTLQPGEVTVWDVYLNDTVWSNLPVPKKKGERAKTRIRAFFEQKAVERVVKRSPGRWRNGRLIFTLEENRAVGPT